MKKSLKILFSSIIAILLAGIGVLVVLLVNSNKKENTINPTGIEITETEKNCFVGNNFSISYNILPNNSTNRSVSVVITHVDGGNANEIVQASATSFNEISGSLEITALAVGSVVIEFKINNTQISAIANVHVLPDPIVLNTPENLRYNLQTGKIMFTSVPNTKSYKLNVNGEEFVATDDSELTEPHNVEFDLFRNYPVNYDTNCNITVCAMGNGTTTVDSAFSTTSISVYKMGPVANIKNNAGIISWDEKINARGYIVKVNGVEMEEQTSTTFDLSAYAVNTYEIAIKAVGSAQSGYVYDSEYSDAVSIHKLAEVSNIAFKNNEVVGQLITNSIITFDEVAFATSYKAVVKNVSTNAETEFSFLNTDERKIILNDNFSSGNYELKITAFGNSDSTIASPEAVFNFEILPTVSNAQISNSVLSFDAITNAKTYEISFLQNGNRTVFTTNTNSFNIFDNLTVAGTYEIFIRAIGDENANAGNGNIIKLTNTITKLFESRINSVNNLGQVSFNLDASATSYELYLDDAFLTSTSTNNFKLNNLANGVHSIYVKVVGNGTTNISSNNSTVFTFHKLETVKVNEITVVNDEIVWPAVENASSYYVKENASDFVSVGNALKYSIKNPKLNNTILIYAAGNNKNLVNGEEIGFDISTLDVPTNIRFENGKLVWDESLNCDYVAYVNGSEIGTKLSGNEITSSTFNVGNAMQVKLKAFPKATPGNLFLSSNYSSVIELNILDKTSPITLNYNEDSKAYTLNWPTVSNAAGYYVSILQNSNLLINNDFVTSNSYAFNNNWTDGTYKVSVYAVGDTKTGLQGYLSGLETLKNVYKLPQVNNLKIVGDKLTYSTSSIEGTMAVASKYEVYVTINGTTTVYNNGTSTSFDFNSVQENISGNVSVSVKAIGTGDVISSDVSAAISVSRLEAPVLNATNGKLAWTGNSLGANITYEVYVVGKGTAPVVTTKELTCDIPNLNAGTTYEVYVVAVADGYLKSEKSTSIKIEKLNAPSNFKIVKKLDNTRKFSWDALMDGSTNISSGFVICETTNPSVTFTALSSSTEFTFGYSSEGNYKFAIMAKGGVQKVDGTYYLNSDYSAEIDAIILKPVSNIEITNNLLTWTINYVTDLDKPDKFSIEITKAGESSSKIVTVPGSSSSFDMSTAGIDAGNYTVKIIAIGESDFKINSIEAVKTNVVKMDANSVNLRVENGELVWDEYTTANNVKYNLYYKTPSESAELKLLTSNLTTTSFNISNLSKGIVHEIYIQIIAGNALNSELSSKIEITILNDVENFKMSYSESDGYKFTWDENQNAEKYILLNKNDNSEVVLNKSESQYILPNLPHDDYEFQIKAIGGTYATGMSYVSGTYGSVLKIAVLPAVTFAENAINNGAINWTNNVTNKNVGATNIKIVVTQNTDNPTKNVYTDVLPSETTSFNFVLSNGTIIPSGNYTVEIYSMGNTTNIITSVAAILPNVTKLEPVASVEILNGELLFNSVNVNASYELYLDNTKIDLAEGQNTYFDESMIASVLKSVKIRAIGDGVIYSDYVSGYTISRLEKITDLRIEVVNGESRLFWTDLANASGYRLVTGQIEELKDLPDYDFEKGYYTLTGNTYGTNGFTIPNILVPKDYRFYVIAFGEEKTLTTESTNIGYLPSVKSNNVDFSVLNGVGDVMLNDGILKWDPISDVTGYKVEIFAGDAYTTGLVPDKSFFTAKTTVDFAELTDLESGSYIVHVFANGDGVRYLSLSTSFSEKIVYKQSSKNLKVLNGKLVWDVSLTDPMLTKLNGGTPITSDDAAAITNIVNGTRNDIHYVLLKNLYGTFVVEISAISSGGVVTTKRVSPTCSIVQNVGLRFTYLLDLPSGNYNLRIRNVGNRDDDNLPTDGGQNLSGNNTNMLNLVFGAYSNELEAFVLPAPRTPIVTGETSIQNNILYWSPVTVVGNPSYIPTYKIVAKPQVNTYQTIEKILDNQPTDRVCSMQVADLNLNPNTEYSLYVYALGTQDSTLAGVTAPFYLTSGSYGSAQVTMLLAPTNVTVKDGIIKFDAITGPVVLNIWNDISSDTFENASSSGFIKRSIEITEETAISNPFILEGRNGYIIEDNNIIRDAGAYKFSIYAKGDGVKTISSKVESSTNFFKYPKVSSVYVAAGKFTWDHVKLQTGVKEQQPVYAYPKNYKVTIYRTVPTLGNEVEKLEEFIIDANENLNNNFITYELPDNSNYKGYMLQNEVMHTAKYSVQVSPYGNVETADDEVWFVTGDSVTSSSYARLNSPENLTVTRGVLNWKAVNDAASYQVLINDRIVEDYEIVTETNSISMVIGSAYPASVYNLKVRSVASFDNRTYLNSISCEPIVASKLEKPAVRIENGILKWNTSELAFVTADSVYVNITGPNGYRYEVNLDYNNIANTNVGYLIKGNDETAPAGEYSATIQFNGATGTVNDPEENEYFWLSSDSITLNFTRVASTHIDIASEEKKVSVDGEEQNIVRNYVYFNIVPNATRYNVVVTTKDGTRTEKFNLELASVNEYPDFSFDESSGVIEFNLNAVSKNDEMNLDKTQFGNSYSVYVEAYGNDGDVTSTTTIYAMGNNSNVLDIEVPQTPILGKLDSKTGTISWQNVPSDTKTIPVLEVSYDVRGNGTYVTEIVDSFVAGDTSYQLKAIAQNYKIRIKSKLNAENGGNAFQSEFSDYEQGAFTIYNSGDGTEANPYVVTTKEQLIDMSKRLNSSFKLQFAGNRLDFGNTVWSYLPNFSGVLDGNNNSIDNIAFNTSGTYVEKISNIAMFGTLEKTAVIKNLKVNVNVTNAKANQYGAIAINNYGRIENCKVTGNVSFTNNENTLIGGVVNNNYGIINKVVNESNISNYTTYGERQLLVGGIAYNNVSENGAIGTIENCGNTGNLQGNGIGGLAYINTGVIRASYNRENQFKVIDYNNTRYVGGLVGENQGEITYCYNILNKLELNYAVSNATYIGGLVGTDNTDSKYVACYTNIKDYTRLTGSLTPTIGMLFGDSKKALNDVNVQTNKFENIYYVENSNITSMFGTPTNISNCVGVTKQASLASIITNAASWAGGYFDVSNSSAYLKLVWEITFNW